MVFTAFGASAGGIRFFTNGTKILVVFDNVIFTTVAKDAP